MLAELFYSHTVVFLTINRGSLHTRSVRHIHCIVLDTDERKMALQAQNGVLEKWAPDQNLTFSYIHVARTDVNNVNLSVQT